MAKKRSAKAEKILREEIEKDLLLQLEDMGARGKYFEDLVTDYMSFWDVKNRLIADIQDRGVVVVWQNGENQFGQKKNDSVAELTKINMQMLKILHQLNIKVTTSIEDDDDDF